MNLTDILQVVVLLTSENVHHAGDHAVKKLHTADAMRTEEKFMHRAPLSLSL
jgi:hypothetical protein